MSLERQELVQLAMYEIIMVLLAGHLQLQALPPLLRLMVVWEEMVVEMVAAVEQRGSWCKC